MIKIETKTVEKREIDEAGSRTKKKYQKRRGGIKGKDEEKKKGETKRRKGGKQRQRNRERRRHVSFVVQVFLAPVLLPYYLFSVFSSSPFRAISGIFFT